MGHAVMPIEISMYLIECISGHFSATIDVAFFLDPVLFLIIKC